MKASELRNKSVSELKDEIIGLLREQFNLRTQRGMGQASQTHQFRTVRRSIARIKTILSAKEGSL